MEDVENTDEERLRVIRFFLPRLEKADMQEEIRQEKSRIRQSLEEDKSRIQRDGDRRIDSKRSSMKSEEGKVSATGSFLNKLLFLFFMIGTVGLILGLYGVEEEISPVVGYGFGSVVVSFVLFFVVISLRKKMLSQKTSEIREKFEKEIQSIKEKVQRDIKEKERECKKWLTDLDQILEKLYSLYLDSIASEEEVSEYIAGHLDMVRQQVFDALGIEKADMLDRRCAEVWSPTFLQTHSAPKSVVTGIGKSAKEIRNLADELVKPMKGAFDKLESRCWEDFKRRVISLWGLSENKDGKDAGAESEELNAFSAISFSEARQTYLAGHYFFQIAICGEECVNVFRAYANILNSRIPYTLAIKIPYADVVSIGVETEQNLEWYPASGMTIEQHTHTLSLQLPSGTTYRMSGDAGSSASVKQSGDVEAKEVASEANQAFRDQIVNVRALIMEAKKDQSTVDDI